jgi:hypothetical protein
VKNKKANSPNQQDQLQFKNDKDKYTAKNKPRKKSDEDKKDKKTLHIIQLVGMQVMLSSWMIALMRLTDAKPTAN